MYEKQNNKCIYKIFILCWSHYDTKLECKWNIHYKKISPTSNLSTTNLTLTNLGSNPDLRRDSAKCV